MRILFSSPKLGRMAGPLLGLLALIGLLAACGGAVPSRVPAAGNARPTNATPSVSPTRALAAITATAPAAGTRPAAEAPTSTQVVESSPTASASPTPSAEATAAAATPTIAATPAPATLPVTGRPLDGQEMVEALRGGGYVIYFRHVATDFSQSDSAVGDQWWTQCDPQLMRQLSEQGRAQAEAIGDAIGRLQIPIGEVLASPYCRTVETARLMDIGPVVSTTDVINMYAADVVGGRETIVTTARRQLSTPPAAGSNKVLVAHGNVIQGAANVSLAEGEAAIFAPGVEDGFALVARVLPDEWAALAEGAAAATPSATAAAAAVCEATPPDSLGPFYEPDAPERDSVGQGHLLSGIVLSGADCQPIPGAQIEFWLAAPDGEYDDDHRATVFADEQGHYRFESNLPVAYGGRPPHIHVRVSAPGYDTLVTQYYPAQGQNEGTFDLALTPQ